jgi:hypothetical protein
MQAEDIEFIINNYKNEKPGIEEEIRDEITEDEAIKIYNEIVGVLASHHLSYKCALNISISLMYAFMTGAAELYDDEMNP